ncbi:MAG TPA: hypothetical protein VFL13_10255, partial [Candidatus Baltobacteraceae bacterium]|nr:hypothetical protein [Candidatus Baltobacteraceae bacterium]
MAAALLPSGVLFAASGTLRARTRGIEAGWTTEGGRFRYTSLRDRIGQRDVPLPREVFSVTIGEGKPIGASAFTIENATATSVTLLHREAGVRAVWTPIAHSDALYLRQEIELQAIGADVDLREVRLFDFAMLPDALVSGRCDGSPIVARNLYLAVEHPLSQSDAIYDRASAYLPRKVPLRAQAPLRVSSVFGTTRSGQLRRDFATYIERERARRYA